VSPRMQKHGDHQVHHSLLVALCHRNAVEHLDPALVEPLGDETFRREFLDLASRHGALGLTLSTLARALALRGQAGPAFREIDYLHRSARRRAAMFAMKRDQVVAAVSSAGVRPVILKGTALAITVYEEPSERDFADLDILVREDRLEQSVRALEAIDYVGPASPEDSLAYRHCHFHLPLRHPDAHLVEIHWALTRTGAPFELDATEFLAQSTRLERPGRPVLFLPRPEHTLLHMVVQNLQEGFSRLARLVDMDRIVASTPGFDWNTLLTEARNGHLASATAVSLQLANRLLGARVPEGVLDELRPGPVARFHLAIMRPEESMLTQRLQTTHAAKRLHEFWLLKSIRRRILLIWQMLLSDAAITFPQGDRPGAFRRLLRLGKLIVLQPFLYAAAAIAQSTQSGRTQMRFW
jgi:hypothetical protein